ncbi:MAG: NAD(P)H-dependent flavin oxidoreductase [Rhodospirillaceae bacterium]
MALPELFRSRLRVPVVGAPMFLVSRPALVIAQCKAGVPGSFPTLNARPIEQLDAWLTEIAGALENDPKAAPYGANLIVHRTNTRLAQDIELVVKHKVPFVITSVGDPSEIVKHIHGYGGIVFHDVTTVRHARKAIQAGVDGLILVSAGAGGHAGTMSPFALVSEVRRIFAGTILLSGALSNGAQLKAAQLMGADLGYMGTRFIATKEASADDRYKEMIVQSTMADIMYTPYFSGVPANYLKHSITMRGLDPATVAGVRPGANLGIDERPDEFKAWRDIWSAGHGVGTIDDIPSVEDLVARLKREYDAAAV